MMLVTAIDDSGNKIMHYELLDGTVLPTDEITPCVICRGVNAHDDCLGTLPGVKFACCGHGDREFSYIVFENGVTIRGFYVDTTPFVKI